MRRPSLRLDLVFKYSFFSLHLDSEGLINDCSPSFGYRYAAYSVENQLAISQ